METLRKQLFVECNYRMKDETMDMFLESMCELHLKAKESLIPYDVSDNNIYILKSGIVRGVYFDGFKEVTHGFGVPCAMLNYFSPFFWHGPSCLKFEACIDSVFMKITKAAFVELAKKSHDFAQWVMWMSMQQLWLNEKKTVVVSGDAEERFEAFLKHRPEIIESVSDKIIASYIGISQQHLCRLKRRFMLREKK